MRALLFSVTIALLGCTTTGRVDEPPAASTGDAGATFDTGAIVDSGGAPTSGNDSAAAVDVATPPDDDLATAQAFVASLGLGVNVERGWAWSLPGDPTSSTSYWAYLRKDASVTHVRLFYPWRPTITMGGGGAGNAPPDEAQFGRILEAAEQAIKAGLHVFLDCTDVMGIEDFTGEAGAATERHMENCARWVAARALDLRMFALGPVNEWAGGDDNTVYNATRRHYHEVLRKHLPKAVLTTGPAYWKSREYLYDADKKFEVFDDLRVVYEWHHYSSLDAAGWKDEAVRLAAWRKAHGGRPTVCGEAGPGYWDEDVGGGRKLSRAPDAWPSRFEQMLGNIAQERPMIWAITYGSEFRVNKSGDDAHLMDGTGGQPDLLKMFVDGATAIATGSK